MLNTDVIETIARFIDDSKTMIEFMHVNRQTVVPVRDVVMRRFPVLTITIPRKFGWKPVPHYYSGDVVYVVKQVVDSRYITAALAELHNPARKHTISFELEVEVTIDLALFDGCRYLKITGESITLPDYRAVERLHIVPGKSVIYTAPIQSAILKVTGYPGRHYNYKPAVHHSQHVDVESINSAELNHFPNIAPGFKYTSSNGFDLRALGARSVVGPAEFAVQFRQLQSVKLASCTNDSIRLLNFAEFDPVVVPNVDFRVPAITYNRLESVTLWDQTITDIDCLSTITELNILRAPEINRLPVPNRLIKLACRPGVDFRAAQQVRSLKISGNRRIVELSDWLDYLMKLEDLSIASLRCNTLVIPSRVKHLTLWDVNCTLVTASSPKIILDKVFAVNIDISSAADIRIDKSINTAGSTFNLIAPLATSIRVYRKPNQIGDIPLPQVYFMTNLQHIDMPTNSFDFEALVDFKLKTLRCEYVWSHIDIRFDDRFPDLTDVTLLKQRRDVNICKALQLVDITADLQPDHVTRVTIGATCESVTTRGTRDHIAARINMYKPGSLSYTQGVPRPVLHHLVLNPVGFEAAEFRRIIGDSRFHLLTIANAHITHDLGLESLPVVSFDTCIFASDVFRDGPMNTKKIYVNNCKPTAHMTIPVFDAITRLQLSGSRE